MTEPSHFDPQQWIPNWLKACEKNKVAHIPNEFDGLFNFDFPEVDWSEAPHD